MIFARRWTGLLVVLAVAAALIAVLAVGIVASHNRLADHLASELPDLADADVPDRLRELAKLGDAGISVLVRELGSQRSTVSDAAAATLHEQLDQWQQLKAEESGPRVARLMRSLVDRSPNYGPRALQAAADLAERALVWPLADQQTGRDQLIRDCDRLVQLSATEDPHRAADFPISGRRFSKSNDSPIGEAGATPGSNRRLASRSAIAKWQPAEEIPGGGVPVDVATVSPLPPLADHEAAASIGTTPAEPPSKAMNTEPEAVADEPPAILNPALSRRIPWQPPRENASTPAPSRRLGGELPLIPETLTGWDDLQVMRLLHSPHPLEAQWSREELQQRGFDDRYLQMAADLTSPDREIRLGLARSLPQLPGIDVRPWLKPLAADEDPEVRLAAIAIIATSGLPDARTWLRQLEMAERHPRVRTQLTRVLQRR